MEEVDVVWPDREGGTSDSSSDDGDDALSCASSDVGSEWTVPEVRHCGQSDQSFPYIFRFDFETKDIMRQVCSSKDDTINIAVKHNRVEKMLILLVQTVALIPRLYVPKFQLQQYPHRRQRNRT